MVYEKLQEGQEYIFQPQAKKVTYANRTSYATVSELVCYDGELGNKQVFIRPDGSRLYLDNLFYIFNSKCYDTRPIRIRSNRDPIRYW